MDDLSRIPVVEREDNLSKSCKMVFITGVIVVLIICYAQMQGCNVEMPYYLVDIRATKAIAPTKKIIDQCEKITKNNQPVLCKKIQLINLNKKLPPFRKVVIIDKDNKMTNLDMTKSLLTKVNKIGSMLEFTLPVELYIKEVILDLDILDKKSPNIITTQIKIRKSDNCITWTNDKPLPLTTYIYVNIVKPHIIYPVQQRILDPGLSQNKQEIILSHDLMENSWK